MDFERAKAILIEAAQAAALEEYEIFYTDFDDVSTETLKNEISSFSSGKGRGIGFRCIINGRMGSASTEYFEENELKEIVSRAVANAEVIESDDPAIIFEGSEKYEEIEIKKFDLPSSAYIRELALKLQGETYAQSEFVTDGTQSGVFASKIRYALANSKGLSLSNEVGYAGAYVQAVVNKNDEAQEAFDFKLGLSDTEGLSAKATDEALSKLGAKGIASGKYKLIIDGKQMRSLLSTFSSVFSGKQAMLGLSLLAGKEGEHIASKCITLVDDPHMQGSPVATSFDGEGVATYRKNVIENGELKTLLYDLSVAQKMNVKPTGNGQRGSYAQQVSIAPFSFYIKGGELTDSQLLEKMGDGILVTELKGLHAGANAVTGDFSIESEGFLIENGKKVRAIKGFTIAGNFFELLKSVIAVSSDVKFGMPSQFTMFGAPNVLTEEMSVAGE